MTVTDLSRLLGSLAREQRSPVPSLTQSPSLLKVRSCEVDYLALAQNPERYRRGGLASPTWVRRHPSPLSDLPSHTLPSNISGSNENTLFVEPRDIFRSTNDQRSSVEWDVEPSDKLHNDRTVDAVDLLDNRGPRPPLAGHSDPGPSPSLSKETETPQRPKQPRGTPGFVDGYRINPKLPPGVPDSNELMLAKSKLRAQEKPAEDKSSASLIFDGVDNQALLRPSEYKHQATIPISSGRSLFSSESISWSSKKNVGVTDGALDAQRTVRFPIETPVDSPQLPTVEVTTSRRRWPLLKKTTEVTRTPLTSVRDRKAPKPPKRQWTFHSAHGMPPASPLYLNRPRFQLLASPSSPLNSPHSANAAQITNAQRILDAFDGEFTYNAFLQVVALGWLRGTSRLYRLEDCPVLALREAINRAGHLHYQKQYEMGETFDDKEDRTPRAINIFSPLISIGCGRKAATDDRQPTPGPPTRISPLTDQPSSPVNQFRQGASVGVAAADGLRVQSPVYPVAAADGLRVQSPVYPVANCRSMDQRFIEGCQRDQPNLWDMVRIHENKGTIPRIPQVSTYLPPNVPTDCLTHPAGATEERQGHARVVVSPLHRKQAISSDEGSSESLASFPLETHPQLPPRLLASTPSSSPLRLSWFNCKSRDVSLNLEGGNPEAESPSDNTLLQFVMPTPTRPVQLESPLPKPALSLHFERCSPGSFDGSVKASSDSDLASLVDGMLLAPVLSSANLFSRPSSEVIDRAIFKADSISYLELEVLLTQLVDVCRSQPLLPCIRHMGGCCFVGSAGSDAWDQPVAGGLTPEDALQRTDLLLVAAFGIHSPADTRSMLRLISLKARYPGRVYILRCRTAVTAITSEVIVGKGAVPPSLLFHDAFEFLPLGLLLSRPNCTLLKGDVDFSDPVRLASITSNRQLIRTPEDELLRNIFDVAPVVHVSRGSHLYLKPH
ncbi:MAG: hypothetical protein KVP17_003179 [Porospora cf. gigantea B]|nr:MAG: hypothetical protein KVP17_003179 [Porospora cf. gigantea B]